ncbi:MAG: ATP-dependent DNA helicase RecG [Dehalococcoidia bacterium]
MPGSFTGTNNQNRAVEALKNILELEKKLEFKDRAVMGGLDKFIERTASDLPWIREIEPLKGSNYSALAPGLRYRWASAVMVRLKGGEAPTADKSKPNRQTKSATPKKTSSSSTTTYTLETPLDELKFIHKQTRPKLARMEISTLRDLLWLFPHRHVDYSKITKIAEVEYGELTTVAGRVVKSERARIGPPPGAAKILINDGTGLLEATFFRQAYLANKFRKGSTVAFSGEIGAFQGRAQLQNPEYEELSNDSSSQSTHAGNLLPVYPSTEGLAQRSIRTSTRKALDISESLLTEFLPIEMMSRNGFPGRFPAIEAMHYPSEFGHQLQARNRLAFEELFMYQLAALKRRHEWRNRNDGIVVGKSDSSSVVQALESTLPFDLTIDQSAALDQILDDLNDGVPMGRLLQGEVGSGKTVVALASLLTVIANGFTGALMAPTEVLAEQHFLSISAQLDAVSLPGEPEDSVRYANMPGIDNRRITIVLLIGSHKRSIKARLQQMIADGEADLVIGTHALLQEAVSIPRLGLAVVDEQHRFGVEQRSALTKRTPRPHLLAMSATPIPRTLALTVYGDLDVTTLKTLPGGRKPITTKLANGDMARNHTYEHVRREVASGRQAFVVCPLIDKSDAIEAVSAIDEFERLSFGEFEALNVGLLHGRMTLPEKQGVMDRFRNRDLDVLVATPVIEVGVDIPNATVMMIMSPQRFGLAQLHQLRGRIGRGEHASECVLMIDPEQPATSERIEAVVQNSDGFKLAEEDLRIRGPGDYMGTRQSGWDELKVATIDDVELLHLARREASDLMSSNDNSLDDHIELAKELERVMATQITDFS